MDGYKHNCINDLLDIIMYVYAHIYTNFLAYLFPSNMFFNQRTHK